MKLKNQVSLQQEKLLEERSSTIENLHKEVDELKIKTGKQSEELEQQTTELHSLKSAVEDSKKVISDNNHGN